MGKYASPYYPPRARWYGRFFYWGLATRHRLALDRIYLPKDITIPGLIGALLVPGLAVYLRGPRFWGKIALGVCAALFLCFVIWMGYPLGNYAFGLMISVHASGFAYYCNPFLREREFSTRILFTVAVLIGLGLFFYAPLRGALQHHWLTPLRMNGHVIVVGKFASAADVRRGDYLMYSFPDISSGDPHDGGAIRMRSGFGYGPVLAVAGDRVIFSTNSFSVNGIEHPLLPHMPQSGSVNVMENQWFIWPDLGISGHGNTSETTISETMMHLALVQENQFVGKPFKRWFWRKQILP